MHRHLHLQSCATMYLGELRQMVSGPVQLINTVGHRAGTLCPGIDGSWLCHLSNKEDGGKI